MATRKSYINPDHITWIMPRDAWLINRQNTQPLVIFSPIPLSIVHQAEAPVDAENIGRPFRPFRKKGGVLMRVLIQTYARKCSMVPPLVMKSLSSYVVKKHCA
jgi:hypothetical protein